MNVAEWILVAILSLTLLIFLIVGIVLIIKLIGLTGDARKVVIKSQDIADNANGIVNNVKGMTSIGGTGIYQKESKNWKIISMKISEIYV